MRGPLEMSWLFLVLQQIIKECALFYVYHTYINQKLIKILLVLLWLLILCPAEYFDEPPHPTLVFLILS